MIPNEETLLDNLGKIAYTLDKAYVSRLNKDYSVWDFEKFNLEGDITYESNIRAVKVTRWVYNKEENPGSCFKNVLSTFADGDHTIAMVVTRYVDRAELFFVIKNEGVARNEESADNLDLLEGVLKGNFPGSKIERLQKDAKEGEGKGEGEALVLRPFSFGDKASIVALSSAPSEYSDHYITQGIDKLLEGIVPESVEEEYSVIYLAESISTESVRDILSGFEEIATAIVPFSSYQFQIGDSNTKTMGEMLAISNTNSISESVHRTHSVNIGISGKIPLCGLGLQAGYGYSWGKSKTASSGKTETIGNNNSLSISNSENTSYTYKSYLVQNLLQRLEGMMERIIKSQSTGLWKFSTYVLAKNSATSLNVANYIKGITQGKESYIEPSIVQEWSDRDGVGTCDFKEIRKYLSHFCHPLFVTLSKDSNEADMFVTPTTYVSTENLSNLISFPRKSLPGLPVLEGVQFGREPHTLLGAVNDLEIGSGYHMHSKVESTRIKLSKEELTKHSFITGSTGSGKTNAIYTMLGNLMQQGIKFLVVEPAKGEYKDTLGKIADVEVYGTNPNIHTYKMLKINPFRFPSSVHILEHLDRLVEIFNVCWPMYAAMPAVLKDAIERAYMESGWDLEKSTNRYDADIFPTFVDVIKQIKVVLDESAYSDDNKGDYVGALVTRIRSLTNGINGLLFSSDDLADEDLFDKNVIVDLSRVGSSETKALIMGLLVLKLQEHRMHQRSDHSVANESLKHITVLEEAHLLLKRTVTQSTEGTNMTAKSVEMIANSIAEMRTYGEGFIIADQSPGLLDMAVIRNTNTKIILRLPDFYDRELVGRAAGLSDNQLPELARLEKGVAVISQSDWIEPVLCKIDAYKAEDNSFLRVEGKANSGVVNNTADLNKILLDCIMTNELFRERDRVDLKTIKREILRSKLDTAVKCDYICYLNADNENVLTSLRRLVYDFLNAEEAVKASTGRSDILEWVDSVIQKLSPNITEYSKKQIDLVMSLIVYELAQRNADYENLFCRFVEIYKKNGGLF